MNFHQRKGMMAQAPLYWMCPIGPSRFKSPKNKWADDGQGDGKRGGNSKRHFRNEASQMDEKLHEGTADTHGPFQHELDKADTII